MNFEIIYWRILSNLFLIPLFLLISIILTVIHTFSTFCVDHHVGRINQETFGAAHTVWCSGVSESSLLSSGSISDPLSAFPSSSLWFGLSMSPFQLSQFSVSELLSGEVSSSLSAGWQWIHLIRRTFNTWVCPPGRSCIDKYGGIGDFSDNLNAAAPSCWKRDQDALTISSVSEMYPTAVICLFWFRNCFCVARRFWLPCHISKPSWTLAMQRNFFSATSLFICMSSSVLVVSNTRSSPPSNPLLAWANCLTMTFSWRASHLLFDCVNPITARPRERLASTPTPWGMIENISRATLDRSAFFEGVSSCYRHQSVISGNQNVLSIPIGSEW